MVREGEMPPDGPPLGESELTVLKAWIDEGVEWDESLLPTPTPETDHWAFRPIRRPPLPKIRRKDWVRTPVDRFIAAEQERLGIEPAAEASAEVLRRRMHLDLLGLPPGPVDPPDTQPETEVPGGYAASDPAVAAATLDALLADPAYGERWGRHWLDVARWAESNGHQHNRPRPHAWRYRDYVIEAVKRKQGHPEPIYVIPKSVVGGMRPDERKRFSALETQIAEFPQTWGYYSAVTATDRRPIAPHDMRWPLPRDPRVLASARTHLLLRGDVTAPGPAVDPGWPIVFGPTSGKMEKPRAVLADWIASPDNPLTARVWANRVWQWHFGRGLVETSGDFGVQGSEPTHAELLDYLAAELISSGWSTKHLHRLIVDSATYRQSSAFSEKPRCALCASVFQSSFFLCSHSFSSRK